MTLPREYPMSNGNLRFGHFLFEPWICFGLRILDFSVPICRAYRKTT